MSLFFEDDARFLECEELHWAGGATTQYIRISKGGTWWKPLWINRKNINTICITRLSEQRCQGDNRQLKLGDDVEDVELMKITLISGNIIYAKK